METTTFEQLLLDAFDQLGPYFETEITRKKNSTNEAKLSADYAGIKSQIVATNSEGTDTKLTRAIPYQLTPAKLAALIGCVQGCWVLEDFHKVKEEEKPRLSQLMKVFMDMATEFTSVKVIAIGAVGTAREVVQYDKEMSRRVSEIYVPLMSNAELASILDTGEKLLNVKFENGVKEEIVRHSNGLASVCHQLALNMCQTRSIFVTATDCQHFTKSDFLISVTKYIEEESDSIKAVFDKATKRHKTRKFDNCNIILRAMLKGSEDGMQHAELLKEAQKVAPRYPASNLAKYLKELQGEMRGGVVVYDQNTNRYRYANPFYRAYAMAIFGAKDTAQKPAPLTSNIVMALAEAFRDSFRELEKAGLLKKE